MVAMRIPFPSVAGVGKRGIGVVVAGLFVLGACSTGSKAAEVPVVSSTVRTSTSPPRTATTVPRSTTTTSTPAYSFDDSVPAPKILNTGTNYVAILQSLENYGTWLAAHHPDPALVSRIIATGTKQHELFALDLVRLRDGHARLVEKLGANRGTYTIISITPDAVSARLVQDVLVHEIVDPTGRITSRADYTGATTYLVLAVRVSGRWYSAAVNELHPPQVHL